MKLVPQRLLVGAAVIALVAGACSSSSTSPSPSATASAAASSAASVAASATASPATSLKPVTVEWWHITTTDPGKAVFQGIADAYMAAHPNVKINITILENEAFKTKLSTAM